MCLSEICSSVRVCKHLSDMFHINNSLKQGDILSPLLFNFSLEYAIRRVQVIQNGCKLSGTHQLLVYAGDVYIQGGSVHIVRKSTESLVVAGKEIGLDVNVDKAKYVVISRDQNAGRSRNVKTDNRSFEKVEQFK